VADEDPDTLRALDAAMPTTVNSFAHGLSPLPARMRHLALNRSRHLPGAGGHISWRGLSPIDAARARAGYHSHTNDGRTDSLKFDVVLLTLPELLGLAHTDTPARVRRCNAADSPCDSEDDRLIRELKRQLDAGGALVVDSGPDQPTRHILRVHSALARHFAHVHAVTVHAPVSGSMRVVHYATSNAAFRAPHAVGAREVDVQLARRLGIGANALKAYDGFLHRVRCCHRRTRC
jgi:hypothetical protein